GLGCSAVARRIATPRGHGGIPVVLLAILLCAALSFGERAYVRDHTVGVQLAPLGNHIQSLKNDVPLSGKHPYRIQDFFWRQDMGALLEYIRLHIDSSETLHMSNGAIACYVTLETGRRTDWGMFWESLPPDVFDRIESSRTAGYFVFRDDPYEIG